MNSAPSSTLVLLGFAEALAAPECVWSLVDAGFTVAAFTRRGGSSALAHSRHVRLHTIDAPESGLQAARTSLQVLLARIREQSDCQAHVLMPMDDAALWLCGTSDVRANGWALAGADADSGLALALDKRQQTDAAREAGFDVPPTRVARSERDLEEAALPFPVILRAADALRQDDGRLRKGRNWICCDQRELASARASWRGRGDLLVQPYLEGTGEGIFGLMTDRGVVAWSAHRRLRMMNPHGSGSSACESRRVDETLQAPVTRFLMSAHWRGLFMFELLRTADGRAMFVEFNGRPWGSMALARRQGFEYPAWAVQRMLGDAELPMPPVPRDGLVCRNLGRELMHLLFVLRGRRSRAIGSWPSFAAALRDVVVPHRGHTLYNWRRNDWRVFASDCWYTLSRNLRKSN
jgi:hypothetical protein